MPSALLAQLVQELGSGGIRVVDLSAPLGPETPVIELPPQFAPSPPVSIETLSHYDENGPACYWNKISLGEHCGTHFDAPSHWITGKDLPQGTTDTIPVQRFIGPACVLDKSKEAGECEDFLLTREAVMAWEKEHGRVPVAPLKIVNGSGSPLRVLALVPDGFPPTS
jgi:kynurenine formamidase